MRSAFSRAPHNDGAFLSPGAVGVHAPNAALLIDFDNVTMGMRSDLSKELKNLLRSDIIRGKVTVQRAYADWRRYPQYIVPLSEASIDLIFAPAYGSSKKNATDIRMAIDGMELVFTRPEIGTFILLTGDSDFSSLVLKLKEYGKYVIGVGIQESSSDILVQNCDEYYSYTSLTGLRKAGEENRTSLDPWVLVERAVEQMVRRKDVMRSDRLKQVMLEIDSSFDEKGFGFSKFSRFLSEAAQKGLIQLVKMENGQFEIQPGGANGAPREAPVREPSASRSREARGRGEDRRGGRGRDGGRSDAPAEAKVPPPAVIASSDAKEEASPPKAPSAELAGGDATPPTTVPAQEPPPPPSAVESAAPSSAPAPAAAVATSAPSRDLQPAHDLMLRAIRELIEDQGSETVRDSDVKRRMLALQEGFDESLLGFPKFSLFLRHAHDHEVIDLRKSEGGNYEVGIPAPKARTPRKKAAERASAEVSSPAATETPGTPSAGSEPPQVEPQGEPQALAGEPQVPVAEESPAPEKRRSRRGRSSGGRGSPATEPERPVAEAEALAEPAPPSSPSPEAEGGDSSPRLRPRQSGRRKPGVDAPPPLLEGQTVPLRGGVVPAEATPVVEEAAPALASVPAPAAPAPATRKPSGRRGGARPATREPEPSVTPPPPPPSPPSPPWPEGDAARILHLSAYKGVGKKTAEILVQTLGEELYRVLENDPDRIRSLLPGARADKLLEAWAADPLRMAGTRTGA